MTQILQEHSSTFYLLSLVALCSVYLALSIRASQVFIALWTLSRSLRTASLSTSLNVTGSSYLPISVVKKVVLSSAISSAIACSFLTWVILDRFYRSSLVELERVKIVSKTDDSHFKGAIRKTPNSSQLVSFAITTCDPLEKDVVAGVTLCTFSYVVDSHLHCFDWNAKHAGYTVWRDEKNDPIITPDAGPPAASCQTPRSTDTAQTTEARTR